MRFADLVTKAAGLTPRSQAYAASVRRTLDAADAGDVVGCRPPKDDEDIDIEDAFVKSEGGAFYVVQGNNGRKLRRFSSKADADKHVEFLHRKNKPDDNFRGAAARKLVQKQQEESK